MFAERWGERGGVRQAQVPEALLERRDKLLSDPGALVKRLKVVALLVARVPANGADIDHAVAKLNKGAAHDGDVKVGDVVQDELDELLVGFLADPADEAVGLERLAELVRRQAVLGEAKVEERNDGRARGLAQLLLLLGEVGAADVADGAFLAERGEEGEHLGGRGLRLLAACLQCFMLFWGVVATRRAGVRVLSTSKRQMVSLRGRSSRGGNWGGEALMIVLVLAAPSEFQTWKAIDCVQDRGGGGNWNGNLGDVEK